MGFSDIGDETTGGLCCFCECLDVARMTGSHLDDGYLMLLSQTEERFGDADIVVEVALCIKNVELLRQDSRNKFLCGSLPVGTSNANDRDVKLTSVFTG